MKNLDEIEGWNKNKISRLMIIVGVFVGVIIARYFLIDDPIVLDAELENYLQEQVLEDDHLAYEDLGYECYQLCDINALRYENHGNKFVVYAWVLDQVFSYQDGKLKEESGSHIPTVFTVTKTDDDYSLEEYWIPGDGSDYVPDIWKRFPITLWPKALDSQRYIDKQMSRNKERALAHFEGNALSRSEGNILGASKGDDSVPDNDIGVKLTAMDITPEGCILFITQKDGKVEGKLETGQSYKIEKLNKYGLWSEMKKKNDEGWEDIAYEIKKDFSTEIDVNWQYLYGTLGEGHYRITKSIADLYAPGHCYLYDVSAEFDVASNEAKEDIQNSMTVDLPERYWIGQYYDNIGWQGGNLILPRAYNNLISEYAPAEWRYSGLLSRIPAKSTDVVFENGIPKLSGIPIDNHTVSEYIDVIGLEQSTDQWSAIMLKTEHDLATPAQIKKLEDKGENLDELENTSSYWEFWFVKEGEDTYYILTLSVKEFTKKEAIDIAKSVKIK